MGLFHTQETLDFARNEEQAFLAYAKAAPSRLETILVKSAAQLMLHENGPSMGTTLDGGFRFSKDSLRTWMKKLNKKAWDYFLHLSGLHSSHIVQAGRDGWSIEEAILVYNRLILLRYGLAVLPSTHIHVYSGGIEAVCRKTNESISKL